MDIEELVTSYMKKDIGQLELIQFLKTTTSILSTKNVKGRRKQNQISFRMDIISDEKTITELQVFESKKISKDEFENLKNKNQVLPEYSEEFTSNFWEEF